MDNIDNDPLIEEEANKAKRAAGPGASSRVGDAGAAGGNSVHVNANVNLGSQRRADSPIEPGEEYMCCCDKVRLSLVMRIMSAFVFLIALFSYVKFFEDITRTGSRDKLGSFFNAVFCTIAAVMFVMAVWMRPFVLARRRLLKWSMVFIMIANFIYGSMYVSDHISPQNAVIVLTVLFQILLTVMSLTCHQWELELEQAQLIAKKKQ